MWAEILERSTEQQPRSARIEEAELAADARSTATKVGRLVDGIAMVTRRWTADALDRIAARGIITTEQRQALAADEAMTAVERELRTAELAGRDREELLTEVLAGRTLDGARSIGQVPYGRLHASRAEQQPTLTSFTDLTPAGVSADYREHLDELAEGADDRRRELGTETAQQAAGWAVAALGPVPDELLCREAWELRAGWAAAERESSGWDDPAVALGPPPPAGLAEKHLLWTTAHTALGLPDADEVGMSDGRLRTRVVAQQRQEARSPAWVGDELADANREAAKAREDALLWTEHAKLLDEKEAAAVRADAAQARDRAVELAEQIERLEMLDQARAAWYVHTAPGRDLAERARTELDSRGADVDEPADTVTGQEWLEEHQRAVAEDEQHQVVTEADVADSTEDDDVTADERWDAADGAAVLDAIEACHVEDERREQLARWAEDDARDAAEPELADAWD